MMQLFTILILNLRKLVLELNPFRLDLITVAIIYLLALNQPLTIIKHKL